MTLSFIPGRALILALLAPLFLSAVAVLAPDLVPTILLVDAIIIAFALADLLLVWKPGVAVKRTMPETISLARSVVVDLEVQNLLRRRLKVRIQDSVFSQAQTEGLPVTLELPANVVRHTSYKLKSMERGPQTLGAHHIRYPSVAGFWTRQITLPAATTVRVFPDVQAVRHYEMLARQNRDHMASRTTKMRGGDTEFERLRDFLPDDDVRRIDWRATARRRKLTTRVYQLERNQNIVFLLDCGRMMTAIWDSLSALDYALNAVLMLTHIAFRRGDQVGLIAFDERVSRLIKPRAGAGASNRIIQATYDLFPKMVESDYDAAFRTLRVHVKKRTLVVLISHAIDEQTANRLQALCRDLLPTHLPLCVLLRDRELEAKASQPVFRHEDLCVQAAAAEMLLWREKIHREMQRAGVLSLHVLPKDLTGSLVTRYLQAKAEGMI